MSGRDRVAAVTGAYGYLGSLIRARLQAEGWRSLALVRAPRADDPLVEHFDLAGAAPLEALRSVRLLVHCAYDLSLVHRDEIDRVNVEGSKRLFRSARAAGVERLVVLSSMSAYPGTTQIYGLAKLAIEAATDEFGGCSVRPGVVYGEQPQGMAGALQKLTSWPIVPVVAGRRPQYLLHEDDFSSALAAIADARIPPRGVISVAHPMAVPIRVFIEGLARSKGRRCHFLPVPGRALYAVLRAGELAGIRMPFRADSLTGLLKPAPGVVGGDALEELDVRVRPFELAGVEHP